MFVCLEIYLDKNNFSLSGNNEVLGLLFFYFLQGCVSFGYAVSQDEVRDMFIMFKEEFNKVYEDAKEEKMRFKRFADKIESIEAHNQIQNTTYKKGITEFSDLTSAEFLSLMTYHPKFLLADSRLNLQPLSELPEEVDWRRSGIISDVRNQVAKFRQNIQIL
jgi:hypothetical protein